MNPAFILANDKLATEIKSLVKNNPNAAELGKVVRKALDEFYEQEKAYYDKIAANSGSEA